MNHFKMGKYIWGLGLVIMILATSCQKEELASVSEDYREELIGLYTGKLSIENSGYSNDGDFVRAPVKLNNYQIEITKSDLMPNAIVIKQNGQSIVLVETEIPRVFEEGFLLNSEDCSGTETYELSFSPSIKQVQLLYKNKSVCKEGHFAQESVFVGLK